MKRPLETTLGKLLRYARDKAPDDLLNNGAPPYPRVSGLNLNRCGWSASTPRRRFRSASYIW